MGITRERIRQIQSNALRKLATTTNRKKFEENELTDMRGRREKQRNDPQRVGDLVEGEEKLLTAISPKITLTDLQIRTLDYYLKGYPRRRIADLEGISVNAASRRMRTLYKIFGTSNKQTIRVKVHELGIIDSMEQNS